MAEDGKGSEMAKEKGSGEALVPVTASMGDEDVVKLAEDGKELSFSFEDFRELDGRVLDKLSRLSLDRYVVELGVWKRKRLREADEAEYGKSDLRVEVMGDNAIGRLSIDGLDEEKWHPWWESPENAYARKKMGYVTVDGRFPEVVAGDKGAGGTRVIHTPDGKDELILMACPQEHYRERVQDQAVRSHGATGAAAQKLEEGTNRIVPGMKTSFARKEIEKVSIAKDPE